MRSIRSLLVVVLGLAMCLTSAPASGQTDTGGTQVRVDRTGTAAGEELIVTGSGWPADATLIVELCGRGGIEGSASCDVPNSVTAAVDVNGAFRVPMIAGRPPRPCPCVIRATDQATRVRGMVAIAVQGMPSVPLPDAPPPPADLEVAVTTSGSGPWQAWFGAPARRTVEIDVTNRGGQPAPDPTLSLVYGRGDSPMQIVAVPALGSIAPGQSRSVQVPLTLESFSFGEYSVVAVADGVGISASSGRATVTTYPWALILMGVVAAQMTLLYVRNRLRGRIARRVELEEPDEMLEIGPGDAVVDLTDERELVLAGVPPAAVAAGSAPADEMPAPELADVDAGDAGDAAAFAAPVGRVDPGPSPDDGEPSSSDTAEPTVLFEVEPVEPPASLRDAGDDPSQRVDADSEDVADAAAADLRDAGAAADGRPAAEGKGAVIDLRDEIGAAGAADDHRTVDVEATLLSAIGLTAAIRRDTDAAIEANRAVADAMVEDAAGTVEAEADEVRRAIAAEHDRAVTEARLATERLGGLRAEAEATVAALRDQAERDRERAAYVLSRAEREADEVVAAARERIARMDQDLAEVHDGIISTGAELRDRIAALEASLDDASLPDLADVDERIAGLLSGFEKALDETRARLDTADGELRMRARVASVEAVAGMAARAASLANDAIDGAEGGEGDAEVADAFEQAIRNAVKRSLQPEDATN